MKELSKMTKAELIDELKRTEGAIGKPLKEFENVYELLSYLQCNVNAPKNKFSKFGDYHYRSAEDILAAAKELLKDISGAVLLLGDTIKESESLGAYVESTAKIVYKDSFIECTAQAGITPDKKKLDLAQLFGVSSSYARKYALGGLLLLDDIKDSDSDEHKKEIGQSKPVSEANKPWLNLNTPEFNKAVAFVKGGGSIDQLRDKFKVSKAVAQALEGHKN